MKETDILFKPFLTRAIIEGRKTQTRRLIKEQPKLDFHPLVMKGEGEDAGFWKLNPHEEPIKCRYGVPGDFLWVKETWKWEGETAYTDLCPIGNFLYKLDDADDIILGWKSSMFMPKRAARIYLKITDIRVQKLQQITDEDAIKEGIQEFTGGKVTKYGIKGWKRTLFKDTPREAFRVLWEQVNGKGSWDENPYLWVLDFHIDKQKSKIQNYGYNLSSVQ